MYLLNRDKTNTIYYTCDPDDNNEYMYVGFLTKSKNETTKILDFLKSNGVDAAFHYQCLHSSQYYLKNNKKESLINSEKFSDQLIRLPLYFDLSENEINYIVKVIEDAYLKNWIYSFKLSNISFFQTSLYKKLFAKIY